MNQACMCSYRNIFIAILIALISVACSSKPDITPLPSPTNLITATDTPIPATSTPIPATPTPTLTPPTHPNQVLIAANNEFMLTATDPVLKEMFNYPQVLEELDLNGNHSYLIRWYLMGQSDPVEVVETITIAQQPWENIPEENFPGSERYGEMPMAEVSPVVGQISKAYADEDDSTVRFVFVKGNSLVNIYALNFSLDDVVNLGKLIEAHLPDVFLDPAPISFPDQLDKATFDKYVKEVTLGGHRNDGGVEPLNVMSKGIILWAFEPSPDTDLGSERDIDTPVWEIAVYDIQAKRYITKGAGIYSTRGIQSACGVCPLQPGQYEFKLAVKGVLVASIPFEVRW